MSFMRKMTRRGFVQAVPALGAAALLANSASPQTAPSMGGQAPVATGRRVATFTCDITPPIGSPLEECDPPVATSVDTPLLAKGVVLSDRMTRYALCAFDYCELHTGTYDLFRRKIADALRVNELQVEVHCIHQHDAPLYDVDADLLLEWVPSPPRLSDVGFIASASERVAAAARAALGRLEPFTHVGYGKAQVDRFASNRRVRLPDGTMGMRASHCNDPYLIAAPEGLIDPWLRTITFFDLERPMVRLHYYASHPQSYYGKGHMNAEMAGLARERLEKEEGVPQIYFTGCGGNVAAGKYNDGSPEARVQLAGRLYQGMKGAVGATRKERCAEISWKTAEVRFAPRSEPDFSEQHFLEVVKDPKQPYHERSKAAMGLAWYQRMRSWPSVDLSYYQLGPARILNLPGEAFVEYQLYAQGLRPDDFIATAAYGELGTGYICTDRALSEGGYEPTDSFVGPPSEARLKAAIHDLLA